MIDLIHELFEQNGFAWQSDERFMLYHRTAEGLKKEFWVVLTQDCEDVLREQSQLYKSCKKLNDQPELDKNISLIIPMRVEDEAQCKSLKSDTLRIEEDVYFFKKHVLIYSNRELSDFRELQGDKQTNDYLTKVITQQSCFEVYKVDPRKLQWQSLVYRVANKIPFIQLKIKVTKDLTSLYDLKSEKVKAKQLVDFEQVFDEAIGSRSYPELSNTSPVLLLNILNGIFNKEDGAENQ
ncbi:ABC-three component system middle component 1 [Pedobacter sp. P351]|uniref:ABC-three component system middle component 1 n=1 Tax=Pedobacter superstes TaxID=3133441 RepID=UPI0030A3CF0F